MKAKSLYPMIPALMISAAMALFAGTSLAQSAQPTPRPIQTTPTPTPGFLSNLLHPGTNHPKKSYSVQPTALGTNGNHIPKNAAAVGGGGTGKVSTAPMGGGGHGTTGVKRYSPAPTPKSSSGHFLNPQPLPPG